MNGDLQKMSKLVLTSSVIFYTMNIILSLSLFTVLLNVGLPVNDVVGKSILESVPLVSGVFNAVILTMVVMSLRMAEYYGIGKSVLALIIYTGYVIAFSPPIHILSIIISIMALNIAQLFTLYYYAKLQKMMFG